MPDNVSLRPLVLDDIVRLREWRNLPEIRKFMYTDHEISVAEHARWFGSAMSDENRRYWIIELAGEPVGMANLYDISARHGTAYWAIYLAEPRAQGRGVASSAERFVLEVAFEVLGLDKVCCEVLATNTAALRLYERFGFRRDGILRQHVRKGDARIDVVTLSILRDEWAAKRSHAAGERDRESAVANVGAAVGDPGERGLAR